MHIIQQFINIINRKYAFHPSFSSFRSFFPFSFPFLPFSFLLSSTFPSLFYSLFLFLFFFLFNFTSLFPFPRLFLPFFVSFSFLSLPSFKDDFKGRKIINFCKNNHSGFANIQAFCEGIESLPQTLIF